MEDNILIKKRTKKLAYVVGITTLIGFCFLLFMPTTYRNPFSAYLIMHHILFSPVALLAAFIIGLISYFIFKRLSKIKFQYSVITLGIFILSSFVVGAFLQVFTLTSITRVPPYKNEIDTNQDGKIDKWVYDKDSTTNVEIDTDHNGTPDVREYYDNGELVKTEKITDLNKNVQKK